MSTSPDAATSATIAAPQLDSLHLHLSDLRPLEVRHADRPVSTAVWHDPATGIRHPVVVKLFTGASAAERAVALHHTGLVLWASTAGVGRPTPAVPRPVAVGSLDDGAAVVMEALTGSAIGARGDLGRSVELAAESAQLFADLHTAAPTSPDAGDRWPGVPRRPADRVVRSTARKLAELADLTPHVASAADGLVSRMRAWAVEIALRGEELVPTHGDAAPRNVLATPEGVRLIDLDRVHLAGAARDVAYWIAWSHATAWTGQPGQEATDDFLVHYLAQRSAIARRDRAELDATPDALCPDLPFHLAAAFVRIVHGWSALRSDPSAQRCVLERATALVDEAPGWTELAWRRAAGSAPAIDPPVGAGCRCGGPHTGANMPACGHQGEDEVERRAGARDRTGR